MKEMRKFFAFWVPEPDGAEVASNQEESSRQMAFKEGPADQDAGGGFREREYEAFFSGIYPVY